MSLLLVYTARTIDVLEESDKVLGKTSNTADDFIRLVGEAFDSVPNEYFHLQTAYKATGITRERIFCYELYHRIRCLQEIKGMNNYRLHGEVDKRGHQSFRPKDQKTPDFVFHYPGTFDQNLLVIEVKGSLKKKGVIKDLLVLSSFCTDYNYKMGLWLIYNYSFLQVKDFINGIRGDLPTINTDCIELICKQCASSTLEQLPLGKLASL